MSTRVSHSPKFRLTKWYADCVSECGDTAIVYHGFAHWGRLELHYSCLLTLIGNSVPRARYSIARSTVPSFDGMTLLWKAPGFRLEGTWESIDPPYSQTVLASDHGSVEWHCLQPSDSASILTRSVRYPTY